MSALRGYSQAVLATGRAGLWHGPRPTVAREALGGNPGLEGTLGQRWGQARSRQVTAGSVRPQAVRPPIKLGRGLALAPKASLET